MGAINMLICDTYGTSFSNGALVNDHKLSFAFHSSPQEAHFGRDNIPTLVFYDALDGRTHVGDGKAEEFFYVEYLRIRMDGKVDEGEIRKFDRDVAEESVVSQYRYSEMKEGIDYEGECVRVRDHLMVTIKDKHTTQKFIVALPDATRFCYVALTGQNCEITKIHSETSEDAVAGDHIPRIAEEVSYIKDKPEGDLPNIQIDGWRAAYSNGILVNDGLKINFHSMSLPTARMIWHCPFVSLFTSDDGTPFGSGYHEYALIRFDGEVWEPDEADDVRMIVNKSEEFEGWDKWKTQNREGIDCEVTFKKRGDRIVVKTENGGISISSVLNLHGEDTPIYASITGDQSAITNIRLS